jgi:hypothetical protein
MSAAKKTAKAAPEASITTFKGFGSDWKCRDFQYAVGESYEHKGAAVACASGFHACEYPLDVFNYYPPAGSKFAVVQQAGTLSRHDGDSKVASSKITISAELNLAGLIKAAIEYTTSRCKPVDPASPASATGTRGAASATGDQGAASATGTRGAASATGTRGAASATGDQGAASATGDQGAAMASGYGGSAKGTDGNALFLVFRDDYYKIIHAKAAIVGRDGIKPDTYYTLNASGDFVEVA